MNTFSSPFNSSNQKSTQLWRKPSSEYKRIVHCWFIWLVDIFKVKAHSLFLMWSIFWGLYELIFIMDCLYFARLSIKLKWAPTLVGTTCGGKLWLWLASWRFMFVLILFLEILTASFLKRILIGELEKCLALWNVRIFFRTVLTLWIVNENVQCSYLKDPRTV